ncbi:unnamed protein product [Protopolystoma xenopodis]|uniref:SHSP domain-containing protein n=1 Tax=Protopolystoma xenopodis TaxID=117903 RepID=A0A448WL63_9PLAT|nr:unnamed protein product [Protopolystoma xenopodis]
MNPSSTLGQSGPTILQDGVQGRKLHLEVPVDSAYVADDLCVRMDANRICITGKTKASTSGGNSDISEASGNVALFGDTASSSSSAMMIEFSRSFEIPETVDPFSVTAQLIGHTLVIEAPLRCTV